jgi:hypothetical protein
MPMLPQRWQVGLTLSHLTYRKISILFFFLGERDKAVRTLAREQASHEARIFRGLGSPFGRVAMDVLPALVCMVSLDGDVDCGGENV